MTTISAKSILASRHAVTGKRIDTLLCRYPHWIHAEGRTHRQLRIGEDLAIEVYTPSPMEAPELSRNASSSRAIPVSKLIKDVMEDPAVPIYWGANQRGMQAGAECTNLVYMPSQIVDMMRESRSQVDREEAWLYARDAAVAFAESFGEAGYHKQIVNRLLEPFSHITTVYSATEWENFFALRIHGDAEPHIRDLAIAIKEAMDGAEVQTLQPGRWHMPFVSEDEHLVETYKDGTTCFWKDGPLIKLASARCASTSYKTVDDFDMTMDRAKALHDRLATNIPPHASPFEHVAQADTCIRMWKGMEEIQEYSHPEDHRNYVGFRQYRAFVERGELI